MCVSVCLSTSISLELLDQSSLNFLCRFLVAMARSSFGGVVIRCVLPILWMTSRLAVVGRMAMHGLNVTKCSAPSSVARLGRSLMSDASLILQWMLAGIQ